MKISPQLKSKNSKTSVFLKFLIRICFLPITFDENEGKIRFKWISLKTLLHVVIYCVSYVLCCFALNFVDKDIVRRIAELNVIEAMSISAGGTISVVAITFPLILGTQLNHMDIKMVWDEQLSFPR